jgi:hypothetical protein
VSAVIEESAVDAHFDVTGKITPRRFTWRGSTLSVEGVGRQWKEGDVWCFMVMAGGRPFELRMDGRTLRWWIARAPAARLAA